MKYLAYLGVALVAFWAGAVYMAANTPPRMVKIVKAEPAVYRAESCTELARACYARKRSDRIGRNR